MNKLLDFKGLLRSGLFLVLVTVCLGPPLMAADQSSDAKKENKTSGADLKKPYPQKPKTTTDQTKVVRVRFWNRSVNTFDRLRKDGRAARKMARYHWLDRAAHADPSVIEAITNHKSAAKILASHPRLNEIAEADHYLCRRITKWKGAARVLAANANARQVIYLDPEGIYRAIRRDKKLVRILSKNPLFDQMISDNPDLGQFIAHYM